MKQVLIRQETEGEEALYRLTADEGKILINFREGRYSVDTYDPSVWYEVDDPGDDRYNEATIEDYQEKLTELGVQL